MSSTIPDANRSRRTAAAGSGSPGVFSLRQFLFGPITAGSHGADLGLLVIRAFGGLALAYSHGMGKVPGGGRYSIDALIRRNRP